MPADRWAKKPGPARAAAQDVDEHEVDAGEQQRVEHQPELAEQRVEVLRAQLRARQLDRERRAAATPRAGTGRAAAARRGAARRRGAPPRSRSRGDAVRMGGGRHVRRSSVLHDGRAPGAGHPQQRPCPQRPAPAAGPAHPVPVPARRLLHGPPRLQAGHGAQREGDHVEDAQRQRQVAAREPDAVARTEIVRVAVRAARSGDGCSTAMSPA